MDDHHFSYITKIEKFKEIMDFYILYFLLYFIFGKCWGAKAPGIFQTRMCSFGVLMVCQSRGEISN
jgi:hypothetical protein